MKNFFYLVLARGIVSLNINTLPKYSANREKNIFEKWETSRVAVF